MTGYRKKIGSVKGSFENCEAKEVDIYFGHVIRRNLESLEKKIMQGATPW